MRSARSSLRAALREQGLVVGPTGRVARPAGGPAFRPQPRTWVTVRLLLREGWDADAVRVLAQNDSGRQARAGMWETWQACLLVLAGARPATVLGLASRGVPLWVLLENGPVRDPERRHAVRYAEMLFAVLTGLGSGVPETPGRHGQQSLFDLVLALTDSTVPVVSGSGWASVVCSADAFAGWAALCPGPHRDARWWREALPTSSRSASRRSRTPTGPPAPAPGRRSTSSTSSCCCRSRRSTTRRPGGQREADAGDLFRSRGIR